MNVQTRMLVVIPFLLAGAHLARAEVKDVQYTSTPIQMGAGLSQFPPASKLFDLSGQISDNTVSFYGLWDKQAIYFAVDAKDTALICNAVPADSQIAWSNDSIELNFDLKKKKVLTPADKDFRQYIFPVLFNNNIYDAYGTGDTADVSFIGTAGFNIQVNGTLNDATADTGYKAVIRIPWADLALTPANNLSFGFDGAVNDRDSLEGEPTWADWAKLQSFAQVDKWNELRIVGGPVNPNTDGPVSTTDGPIITTDGQIGPGADLGSTQPPRPSDKMTCDCSVDPGPPPLQVVLGLLFLGVFLRRRR